MRLNRRCNAHRAIQTRRVLLAGSVVTVVGLLFTTTGANAHAEAVMSAAPTPVVLAQAESVEQVLENVRTWVVGILALLATVFLTIGGVRYILGSGDPGEIEKAKTAFRSACVGYALAVLAPLVVTVLQGIVGA